MTEKIDIFDNAYQDKNQAKKVRRIAIEMSRAGILTDNALRQLLLLDNKLKNCLSD